MVLEGLPTRVMTMIVIVVMVVVVIQRQVLATNQGRGAFSDPTDRQTQTHSIFSFLFIFLFISMYFYIVSFIWDIGLYLRTSFTFTHNLENVINLQLIGIIAQFYAILFFLIFNAWKYKLDCALSSLLRHWNHGRGLGGEITLQIGKWPWFYLPSCIQVRTLAYASLDHAYAGLTLHMCVVGQKNHSHPIKV